MAVAVAHDVDSGEESYEDALESQPKIKLRENGHIGGNPDSFELLFPALVKTTSSKSFRERLPILCDRSTVNLWSILKNLVGKDVTRIAVPVHLNEPLSFLQRLCEDIEYTDLLNKAADAGTEHERLAYLAALSSSCFVTVLTRHSKPFNPLLGETFELVHKEHAYCLIAEQVSHHPPVTAMHCESTKWVFWEEYNLDIKFRGQWVKIQPRGLVHFKSKADGHHYSWNKPHTTVHNLIIGQLWADNEGDVVVKSHQTDDQAIVRWMPYSKSKDRFRELKGEVLNAEGDVVYLLDGRYDRSLRRLNPDGTGAVQLWTANEPIEDCIRQYGFTHYSMMLNEEDDTVKCPTDSRKRPDQRLLEDGQVEEASAEKHRLEEKQRTARKARERRKEIWKPLWFDLYDDPDTKTTYYAYNGKYWQAKLNDDYSQCPDIF